MTAPILPPRPSRRRSMAIVRARPIRTALLAAAALCGCRAGSSPAQPDAQYFVAFAPDFYGFHAWPSAIAVRAPTLPAPDGGFGDAGADGGLIHNGPLTVYWKQAPPPGSTSFPLGTIIVKETDDADITARQVFAMVKRGEGFNAAGASGWEWFELRNVDLDSDSIVWRGVGPPAGERYGGNPATCNDCHAQAAANDCVWSSALQLANF